ncbi:hypothetical protein AB0K87_36210 [Streptomyces sp. NPDC053705]
MPDGRHTEIRPPARPFRRRPRALAAAGLLGVLLATGACGASSDRGP